MKQFRKEVIAYYPKKKADNHKGYQLFKFIIIYALATGLARQFPV